MLNYVARFFLVFTISIILLNCSDEGVHPRDANFVIPESDISFVQHIQPMLFAKCGSESGCHSSVDNDTNGLMYLHISSKQELMDYELSKNGEKLLEPEIHYVSPEIAPLYLLFKEGYPDPEDQMPPYWLNRSPLNENQLTGIRNWIAEGATD